MTRLSLNAAVEFVRHTLYTMSSLSRDRLSFESRNYNFSCGYPEALTVQDYREFYDRWSIAKRIVDAWPKESWQVRPAVFETNDPEETKFEVAFNDLNDSVHLFHYLTRADVLSGIGRYGVILFGVDDGQRLDQEMRPGEGRRLMYLRVLDEMNVDVSEVERDETNERYSQPTYYNVKLSNAAGTDTTTKRVHWSRVIHVADNRETDEVYGVPRLQSAYNHVFDVRKVTGGGSEMFWKGGFPGFSVEVSPDVDLEVSSVDKDSMRDEMKKMFDGLQRYAVLQGATLKSLEPQVADPRGHFEILLDSVCIGMEMPKRIFLGTEQAKLASEQDQDTWQRRLRFRQENYVTPLLVRPVVDRLIWAGVLPEPEDGKYDVEWPNVNEPDEAKQVLVAKDRTEALAKYVQSGASELVPPRLYLTMVHKFDEDDVRAIENELDQVRSQADLDGDLDVDPDLEVDGETSV